MKKIQFTIAGMHCSSCAVKNERGLKKVLGVKDAVVNYGTSTATVEFDEKKTNHRMLHNVIIKNGYKVTYFLYDWHSWDKETVSKSAKNNKSLFKTLGKLKSQKVSWVQKRLIQKEFNFAKSGGDFKFVIPSSNIIDKFLLNKIPVIVQVWAQDLYQDPKEDYRQAIIVTGKKDDKYLVKDPYLALEAISENELIHASIKNGGRVMVIEPSEKNVKLKQERLNF